jgi:hypothetical protein
VLTKEEVISLFKNEFSHLAETFITFELSVEEARNSKNNDEARPGVYVYWHPEYGVLKTGKSQDNSRKRALEHIRDNTSHENIQMALLGKDAHTIVLLFNIKNDSDLHWVLALEAYMEWNANPKIKSARMG